MGRNVDKNEPAYWTNEVAEQLGQGDSTIRKWSLALEEQGYEFIKGEQERRLFLEDDIHLLSLVQEELKRQDADGEKKDLKAAAEFAYSKWRTRVVPVEEERTGLVLQNNQFDYEAISKMLVQELRERDSLWLAKFERLEKMYAESEKRHEERGSFLLKKLEEQEERRSFLENKIQEIKEEQKASRKLIESNVIDAELQKTNQMFEEVMKEIASTKKKGFFRRLFGK